MQSRVKRVDNRGGGHAWSNDASGSAPGAVRNGLRFSQTWQAGERVEKSAGAMVKSRKSSALSSFLLTVQLLRPGKRCVEILASCAKILHAVFRKRCESNQRVKN